MPQFEVITFDCYGTLIDWETGIREAFGRAAKEDGVSLPLEEVVEAYAQIEPAVEAEAYRPYQDVLRETASRVAARFAWDLPPERACLLPESLPSWAPFADTNPALERLAAAGCRLGILSNVDEDLLRETRRHFSVSFDTIVTAQQVRSYKPDPGHFLAARARLGPGVRWLHAAQSDFHDVEPARRLGIPVAWINRKKQRPGAAGPPDWEFEDLAGLADWIARG